jgi:hypothetical protein
VTILQTGHYYDHYEDAGHVLPRPLKRSASQTTWLAMSAWPSV